MLLLLNWLAPLSTVMAQKTVPYSSVGSSTIPHGLADAPARKPSPSFTGDLLSHPFLQALLSAPPPVLLDLVNGLSDDIYTLSRLGLVGPKMGARAGRFSDWCWLFGTLVGLVENGVEMSMVEGLQRRGNCRLGSHNVLLTSCCSGEPSIYRVVGGGDIQVSAHGHETGREGARETTTQKLLAPGYAGQIDHGLYLCL